MLKENQAKPTVIEFSCNQGLRQCLLRGVGVTICPRVSVERELASGELRTLAWHAPLPEAAVFMIWHTEKWCSPLLNAFMRYAREGMEIA